MAVTTKHLPVRAVHAKSLQSCPTLQPCGLYPARLLCPWDSPGKNKVMGCLPSSRGSFQPRDQTRISYGSCIAGRFFTAEPPGKPGNKSRKVKSLSRVRLFATPWTVAYQAPLSMGFSRQGCWSGLPFPSPGDLPNPGIKSRSPALQADALPSEPPGKL